ncbi:Dienelactone hydrolase family protein [Marinomonas spartinae]|uniref:Dienelactone hydrolase family protein n=1 Tax=Marinomonas spartinae TaxID=1792290 RepID=A0A1A8TDI2_9GAMM|nr:dienelactone hydrolase family protein [Marinomonas spartinae]SBS29810.1 Dienelactone hydrolase family protein [Marinomonas spartinae]
MNGSFQSLFVDNVSRQHYQADPATTEKSHIQVVIWPTFSGLTQFEKGIADQIAAFGYSATALDLYGTNTPESMEDKRSIMGVLLSEESPLHDLQRSLVEAACPNASGKTIVHVGFCLGGRLSLEAGLHLTGSKGAVSFHGLMSFYRAAKEDVNQDVKIMVLNGYDDHLVSDEDSQSAKHYWTELGIDFQFMDFGNTMHSFMLPSANNPDHGSMYNPTVAKRGYHYLEYFLSEF